MALELGQSTKTGREHGKEDGDWVKSTLGISLNMPDDRDHQSAQGVEGTQAKGKLTDTQASSTSCRLPAW